ncbi:trk system potassium uptake protein TrkH [Tindallia magadiensis]|uniref:Trk system potassium uptake protein TrkH n=1 Tax=Tindallia magadiensis TaxID=69895 RepID=A0A1I3AUD4_9FIRM|nr:TrkH family potassium uptake protein [Tindallia magadiensis]SFH53623.1 trk system potassium uptake protein TrkH [Tindallia magadiensis]
MNYGVIIRVLGSLLVFKGIMLLPAIMVSFLYRESAVSAFLMTVGLTLLIGIPCMRLRHSSRKIKTKEALVIVAGGWIVISFFGALPFYFSGSIPHLMDAFFEAVSGFTTTGATILDDIESLPKGILFWRSFTHWLGGMGILVLTLAILPAIGVGGFQIFKAESPGPISDKLVPKMHQTATILYTAYFGMTVLQTILLMFGGLDLYEALTHTFGTVGTGGFSIYNDSAGAYDSAYVQWVITVFMIAAGVNFALYYELYRKKIGNIVENTELRLYLLLLTTAMLALFMSIQFQQGGDWTANLRHTSFQVASIMTTTGYTTVDYELWSPFAQSIIFFLMFIGGCAGSTGGGIKVIRILVLFKLVKRQILKVLHPRAMVPIQIQGRMLQADTIASVTSFVILYILILLGGMFVLSLEGLDLVSAISASAATLGNIGPGFGFIGPTQTYSEFSYVSKGILSLFMLMGRLELFTVFILLTPSFWRESR